VNDWIMGAHRMGYRNYYYSGVQLGASATSPVSGFLVKSGVRLGRATFSTVAQNSEILMSNHKARRDARHYIDKPYI
jgi:hypothetical protein